MSCTTRRKTRFSRWKPPHIEHGRLTKWNWLCQYPKNLKLGRYVDIGAFTYINAECGVEIQDYAQIGSHCSIYSVSTIDKKCGRVVVGKNARIGSHSVVMPRVIIGDNSLIGAFSFINADVPSRAVAYGIPARTRRKLTKSEIEALSQFE